MAGARCETDATLRLGGKIPAKRRASLAGRGWWDGVPVHTQRYTTTCILHIKRTLLSLHSIINIIITTVRSRPLQDIHRRADIPIPSPSTSPCPPNQRQPPGTKTTDRARFHSLFPIPIPALDTYTYPRRDATPGRCRYRVCTRCRTTRQRDNSPLRACRAASAAHHRRARPEEGESTGRR